MALVIILVVLGVVVIALGGFVATTRTRTRRPSSEEAARVRDEATTIVESETALLEAAEVEAEAEAVLAEEAEALAGAKAGAGAGVVEVGPRPALRDRLGRARALLGGYLDQIRGRGVDDTTFEELEEALILADVGISTTTAILDDLRARVKSGAIERSPEALLGALRADLEAMFEGDSAELRFEPLAGEADGVVESGGPAGPGGEPGPTVWLFVGVNGVGKTTTIGKVAAREAAEGKRVVLAAGDTFRAAAGEQLETWADRSNSTLIRGSEGADPSSVIFDAVQHAAAREADLVMADTAGRLHTKTNLMDELRKVRRVAARPPGRLAEVLLVLDATTGQNAVVQARQFTEAVGVTGIVLTKLDGTAKGGVVLAIRNELGLPIKLVGVGEGLEDLVEFDPREFVAALFG